MQSLDKTGIICDYCNSTNRLEFIYHSFDFKQVDNNGHKVLQSIVRLPTKKSFDICTLCYDEFTKSIIKNYKNLAKTKVLYCEVTGAILQRTTAYYFYVLASKVSVKIKGQPSVCVNCKQKTFDTNKQCKCGSKQFITPALVNTEDRILEFTASQVFYDTLVSKQEDIKGKISSGWSTKT
jgi:hypothetical protein